MAEWAPRVLTLLGATLFLLTPTGGQVIDSDGAILFARYCAACHGQLGEGDGPVASVMLITVPNLRTLSARSNGSFPRDAVMQYIDGRNLPAAHGDRLMPVWGDAFAKTAVDSESGESVARTRITAITEFVERLQN